MVGRPRNISLGYLRPQLQQIIALAPHISNSFQQERSRKGRFAQQCDDQASMGGHGDLFALTAAHVPSNWLSSGGIIRKTKTHV